MAYSTEFNHHVVYSRYFNHHAAYSVKFNHNEAYSIESMRLNLQSFLFVCVEVLRPSQPNGVMLSAVNLPNHTFTGQAQSSKRLSSIVHILRQKLT